MRAEILMEDTEGKHPAGGALGNTRKNLQQMRGNPSGNNHTEAKWRRQTPDVEGGTNKGRRKRGNEDREEQMKETQKKTSKATES